jgi:hypothetical protein
MAKCWNCGDEIPENATFCPTCGKSVAPSAPQSSSYYDHPRYNHNKPSLPGPNFPTLESPLERKVNNLYKLVIVALVLEAIIFLIA